MKEIKSYNRTNSQLGGPLLSLIASSQSKQKFSIQIFSASCRFIFTMIVGMVGLINPLKVLAQSSVTIREVDKVIPKYGMEAPNPNPMFFFGQGSQGAEGRIYPYPFYYNLTNVKVDKTYHVIYLENEYIKISALPEIGGRLFSGLDKTNNYDFVAGYDHGKNALDQI